MAKENLKKQHTPTYVQVYDLLSHAAKSLTETNSRVTSLESMVCDAGYKATRQLAWNWLAPEWAAADGEGNTITYAAGSVVRCNGWVFKALSDTGDCPYTVISDDNGLPIVNDDYQLLITDNINEGNWAGMSEQPAISIEEIARRYDEFPALVKRVTALEEQLSGLLKILDDKKIVTQ